MNQMRPKPLRPPSPPQRLPALSRCSRLVCPPANAKEEGVAEGCDVHAHDVTRGRKPDVQLPIRPEGDRRRTPAGERVAHERRAGGIEMLKLHIEVKLHHPQAP